MFIPPYILISFIGALVLIVFTIAYLYYLYTKEREFQSKEQEVNQNTSKIIEEAQSKANEIVQRAVEKAQNTIEQTEYLRADLVKNLEANLNQLASRTLQLFKANSQNVDQEYKSLFENTKQEYVTKINNTLKSLEQIAGSELDEFSKNLKKETLDSQVFIGARINEEFEKKQKEIEEYKSQRLKAIDENINKIIAKVAQNVLGRAIPLEEHEQLVLDALEKAKKEEVFI